MFFYWVYENENNIYLITIIFIVALDHQQQILKMFNVFILKV